MTSFVEYDAPDFDRREPQAVRGLVHNPLTLAPANALEAEEMVDFFRAFEEVAFCDWQDTTRLRRILLRDTTLAYVARNRYGTLVGAIIGGLLGTRGTINHLAVSEPYRQRGIGETLVERLIRDMKRQGVRRLFLFVDDDNATGQSFWDSQGFNEARGETTYEKDL